MTDAQQSYGDNAEKSDRSMESAAKVTKQYTDESRSPLANHAPNTEVKTGITFAAQDKLPKLPIPDLEHTTQKYLDALEPLQSSREQEETKAAIQEFLSSEGPELQDRLKKYATGKSSYIEQFWYDSYLNYDNPVVLNLNPFFLLEDDPTPARNNQVTRAASLVISALSFVRAVRKEELPPDMVRNQPLDMYQYSRMFGTARIPTDNGCQIAQDSQAKHLVVLCRGQFYWFDALDDNNDIIMTEKSISQNLDVIVNDAEQTSLQESAKGAVGVLSTENRKIWSHLRDVISRDEGSNNSDCLNFVDSSLFILCLDDSEPLNSSALCQNMLCGTSHVERGVQVGTCTNRWYDKMQIIVCKNGSAGINFEHTGVDGHTVLRFASDIYTDTILRFARSINGQAPTLWASESPDPKKRDPKSFGDVSTSPRKLEWDMIPELSTALRFAETRLADLIQQNEFQTLEFMQYGSNFMKESGFSPDSFVQMAFQAAYYGLYGRMECMYEPAMTKVYYHGRTEAIRQLTPESADFVRTFWADQAPIDKCNALRKAAEKHVAITRECSKAQGHDRHLYALFCVWQRAVDEEGAEAMSNGYSSPADSTSGVNSPTRNGGLSDAEDKDGSVAPSTSNANSTSPPRGSGHVPQRLPSIFSDPGWDKINNTILSTSNCGNPSLRHFGFGPTSGEGFGIGYIIKEGSISICASSKHRQTKRYIDALESYFIEIRKLLRATRQRGASQAAPTSRNRAKSKGDEEEEKRKAGSRLKSRGRIVTGDVKGKSDRNGAESPRSEAAEDDDDGLGGYGFFDAGMLLKTMKQKEEAKQRASEKAAMRSHVGRGLRPMEY